MGVLVSTIVVPSTGYQTGKHEDRRLVILMDEQYKGLNLKQVIFLKNALTGILKTWQNKNHEMEVRL
jgi:hypothetical protein